MSNQMIKIARVSDFDRISMRSYKILARPVGVFKEGSGRFRAMEVGCKHQNADLLEGKLQGDVVTCPWHGWKYNLKTGECVWGSTACLRPYALEVRGEFIYVSIRPVDDDGIGDGSEW